MANRIAKVSLVIFFFIGIFLSFSMIKDFWESKRQQLDCTNSGSGHCQIAQAQDIKKAETDDKANTKAIQDEKSSSDLGGGIFSLSELLNSSNLPQRRTGSKDLHIWATSSVVIDADSGAILHYFNGKNRTQVASLTKIMTAVLVFENIDNLEEEVTITREALIVPGTVVGCPRSGYCLSNRMYVGEKVKVIDLLKAMLMNSANDAATALGIHIAGSEKKFVDMMNEKARSLGFMDTNFCTPSGLEIDGRENECYSTAYDIARIAAYSLKYKKIWEIMRIPEDRFYSCDGSYMHELKNTDLLISSMENCFGGKTGFTPLAGRSLLTGAHDATGKHKVIAVVLNDERRWEDMRILINWVFQNYTWDN